MGWGRYSKTTLRLHILNDHGVCLWIFSGHTSQLATKICGCCSKACIKLTPCIPSLSKEWLTSRRPMVSTMMSKKCAFRDCTFVIVFVHKTNHPHTDDTSSCVLCPCKSRDTTQDQKFQKNSKHQIHQTTPLPSRNPIVSPPLLFTLFIPANKS